MLGKDMREERSSSPSEPSTCQSRPGVDGPLCFGPHFKQGETHVRNDEQQMADKVVLITGGTGGIGKATAIRLATIDARVGITGRDLGVVPCQRCPGVGRLVPRMRVRGRVGQYKGPSSRLHASAPT